MYSQFKVPDSLKKNAGGNGESPATNRPFQRTIANYADLDDPNGDVAPPAAPERRPRLLMQDRSKYQIRRAPDGSMLPKPTMPPRTVGSQLGGAPRAPPPARGTLTRAGLIPAGARNPYTLRREVAGRPAVPERHPSPAVVSGESEEEGELPDEEKDKDQGRGPSGSRPGPITRSSLFGGGTVADSGSATDAVRSMFGTGRNQSPSRLTRRRDASPAHGGATSDTEKKMFTVGRNTSPSGLTRRREASPAAFTVPPSLMANRPPSLMTAAGGGGGGATEKLPEGRGERSTARTLTAHDLTGMRSVSDVTKQLKRLIGRACPGDFDRYQLLDERDKLLCKLREIKPSFFSKSGSCKDMCPEKERYVRVVQMRVADYEMDMLGEMEPRRMVKEYSRSAADQEEPLEHEMRPPTVLETTMEYLLTDIVDSTIESSPDSSKWYDFLWNRTRAIRKEITQQMILEESAVRLIECCTRMHMYAGFSLGRLRQEEFDPKMNDENLSKCLQSLRHLYEDLAKKEIFVESEAEFRAYDVMLHLTDSNILRQVLSYRRSVRESPSVRLALKLFSAIQSNNYTRFFRLVREQATYSQCCILFRYFGKMRLHAFSTIVSAYKGGTLPMDGITRVLAFESVEQAIEVAAQYELSYTQDAAGAPALLPDAKDFNPAVGEVAVPAVWIEQKREGRKLSEIFRGGPSRQPHLNRDSALPPVDSFDPVTGAYSHDPVLKEYLERLGSDAPEDPFASQLAARVQQKRAEMVVERPVGAAAAAASRPAFGGMLSSFGKPTTGATTAAGGGLAAGGALSAFGKPPATGGSTFGSGLSSFGTGAKAAAAPSFGGFGAKSATPSGFSFASGSKPTASEPTTVEKKKPLFGGIKQESDTVPKPKPKLAPGEAAQTAEKLLTGVVDEVTKSVVRDTVAEEQAAKQREEDERRERERREKDQREREALAAAERAAAAAAAARSAEKRKRSEQARLTSCSEHLFKRVVWPSLVKEVIDATTKEIAREAVREEEQRIADGLARYKRRMHDLWLRQFTDRWREYAKWRKEERQRVRQVLAAVVSRNPFEGIGAQALKRRLSSPKVDEMEAKRRRSRPYANIDPMTAFALISFVERRQARIARWVVDHWREWAERRARRRDTMKWPLNRACAVPRVRPPTPTNEEEQQQQENGGYGNTSLPLMERGGARTEKKHKSRRSIGLYPFLSADDSFLDGRATPMRGVSPVMREEEEGRRRPRVSGIFNSTAVPETTAAPAIGFQTFVGRHERSAVSDYDVEYAKALMEQSRWTGEGARERWRRREGRGEEAKREEWKSRPLVTEKTPSWRGLFDALNDETDRGREREALRDLETPAPLNETLTGVPRDPRVSGAEWTRAPMPPHPWEREDEERRARHAAVLSEIEEQLAESKRVREEAAADRARQDAMLARYGC